MLFDLSKLFVQLLLPRQPQYKPADAGFVASRGAGRADAKAGMSDPDGIVSGPLPLTAIAPGEPGVDRGCGQKRPRRSFASLYARSNRSRFITLAHAATKSFTNFSFASSAA